MLDSRRCLAALLLAASLLAASLLAGQAAFAQAPEQGSKPAARAPRAMASASHPLVTRTLLDVLRSGGNAVDAAITAVILKPVLEPQMSTLAGGMSMLIYEAKTGQLHYLDAELDHTREGAPIHHTMGGDPGVAETSGRRVGVPGTVAGLHAAAERFGTRPWADYFTPAIRLARDGFEMYSFLYGEMAEAAMGRLALHASGREEYLGRALRGVRSAHHPLQLALRVDPRRVARPGDRRAAGRGRPAARRSRRGLLTEFGSAHEGGEER